MNSGLLLAGAAAAAAAYFIYQSEKKDNAAALQQSFQGMTKPIPPAPGAYECPNSPGIFALPGYMYNGYDGIVVSSNMEPQFDKAATPIMFSNGFSYWFRQAITDDFLKSCPAPQ
jgi:hypothetical protein